MKTMCLYKIGSHCHCRKFFDERCSTIREYFCPEKQRIENSRRLAKHLIEKDYPSNYV